MIPDGMLYRVNGTPDLLNLPRVRDAAVALVGRAVSGQAKMALAG
jgi:hypothetical protein